MYGANTYKEANKNYQTVLINIIQNFCQIYRAFILQTAFFI